MDYIYLRPEDDPRLKEPPLVVISSDWSKGELTKPRPRDEGEPTQELSQPVAPTSLATSPDDAMNLFRNVEARVSVVFSDGHAGVGKTWTDFKYEVDSGTGHLTIPSQEFRAIVQDVWLIAGEPEFFLRGSCHISVEEWSVRLEAPLVLMKMPDGSYAGGDWALPDVPDALREAYERAGLEGN